MKTQSTRIHFAIGAATLWLGLAAAPAAPLQVSLHDTRFSTYIFVATNAGWSEGVSASQLSPVSCSDALAFAYGDPQSPGEPGSLGAAASATTFGVSVRSYYHAGPVFFPADNATARAESRIEFSPLTSGLANLTLTLNGAQEWFYSAGGLSLLDLTTDQTLWDYEWNFSSFIPGAARTFNPDGSVEFAAALDALFDSNHLYALTLHEQSWADSDRQQVSVQLGGLGVASVIPEPSALALTSISAAVLLGGRRPRTRGSTAL
jgi:hypothetical protein